MPTAYVTVPPAAASDIARTLVEERLAACVNRVPCDSTCRWDGEILTEEETILLCKTTDEGYATLAERIVELHPYDVPCIERFEEGDVFEPFAEWRAEAVGPE